MDMKLSNRIFGIIRILLLVCFLHVLLCVVFVGTRMDYWETVKISTRLPNPVLAVIAAAGLAFCIFLLRKSDHIRLS